MVPFIESNYKVSTDRTIVGHSLGGSIGFYSLLTHPKLFNRYLLVSPSLWYDDKQIFQELNKSTHQTSNPIKIYTAIGSLETTKEGMAHDMVSDLKEYVKLMQVKFPEDSIKVEVLDNETHRSVFPRAYTNGMRVLFK